MDNHISATVDQRVIGEICIFTLDSGVFVHNVTTQQAILCTVAHRMYALDESRIFANFHHAQQI